MRLRMKEGLAGRCDLGCSGFRAACASLGIAKRRLASTSGQSTVEAAFLIPVLFCGILLLVQPGILLYDRIVMQGAAAEGCRLLATSSDTAENGLCEQYIRRRLGAIPPQENFHVHEGGCTWDIDLVGSESSDTVSVSIATEVKPLPLIDAAGRALGFTNDRGNLRVAVSATMPTQPAWARDALGGSPSEWVGAWAQ